MIKIITEKETQLANMLRNCSETLKQVTEERDDLSKLVQQALDERDHYLKERDKLADELKALRDSGVELPESDLFFAEHFGVWGYSESKLRDYGDRRAMAERERAAMVCDLAATQCGETLKTQLGLSEKLVARGAQVQAEKLAEAIRKGE